MSVMINSQPITVAINSEPITVEIVSAPINIEVSGARGATGVIPERILYVADIARAGNFLGTMSVTETLINNTGKTFSWSGSGVDAYMTCSDPAFLDKIISVTWYLNGGDYEFALYHNINSNGQMVFSLRTSASNYRCAIEFYNF